MFVKHFSFSFSWTAKIQISIYTQETKINSIQLKISLFIVAVLQSWVLAENCHTWKIYTLDIIHVNTTKEIMLMRNKNMLVLFQSSWLVRVIASSFDTDHGFYRDFRGCTDTENLSLKVSLAQRGSAVAPEEVSSGSSGNSKQSRCLWCLWFCCRWNLWLLEQRTVDFPPGCWRVDIIQERAARILLGILLGRHSGSKEAWLSRNLVNNLIPILSVILLGGHCLGRGLGMILQAWLR